MRGTKLHNTFELKAYNNGNQMTYISLGTCINAVFEYHLLHGAESICKLTVLNQTRNSPHFMEPENAVTRLQLPATCPYSGPDQSHPWFSTLLPEYTF